MQFKHKIAPCLWFDMLAEEAAVYYVSVFRNSRIVSTSRYTAAGFEFHHKPPGSVMMVAFELEGQLFSALNGGPGFKFNEAISLVVYCDTQEELDYLWERLGAGGDPRARQCGWLKDRWGVSWQLVPSILPELMTDPDSAKTERTMRALLEMKKLDIAALLQAHAGRAGDVAAQGRL